jgi:FMN-dependent NADH-azoreductase
MRVLNIVTSPRKEQSVSRALVDAFLREYMTEADDIVVDDAGWKPRICFFIISLTSH